MEFKPKNSLTPENMCLNSHAILCNQRRLAVKTALMILEGIIFRKSDQTQAPASPPCPIPKITTTKKEKKESQYLSLWWKTIPRNKGKMISLHFYSEIPGQNDLTQGLFYNKVLDISCTHIDGHFVDMMDTKTKHRAKNHCWTVHCRESVIHLAIM